MRLSFRNRSLGVAGVAIAVLAISGFQCARISDRVTGSQADVTVGTSASVASCVRDCNDSARQQRDAENTLHKANLDRCRTLDQPERAQCMDDEDVRHAAAMDQIEFQSEACKGQCHDQGSGTGGQ